MQRRELRLGFAHLGAHGFGLAGEVGGVAVQGGWGGEGGVCVQVVEVGAEEGVLGCEVLV